MPQIPLTYVIAITVVVAIIVAAATIATYDTIRRKLPIDLYDVQDVKVGTKFKGDTVKKTKPGFGVRNSMQGIAVVGTREDAKYLADTVNRAVRAEQGRGIFEIIRWYTRGGK